MAMLDWVLGYDNSVWCRRLGRMLLDQVLHTLYRGHFRASDICNLYL